MNHADSTTLTIHQEGEQWWAEDSRRPGWSAVADSLDELSALIAEARRVPPSTHEKRAG